MSSENVEVTVTPAAPLRPVPNQNYLLLDVEDNPKEPYQWVLFPVQHVLAMLVACITVPLLTGLPVPATLVSAGLGTLFYHFVTRRKSPVFLSSSFAYLAPMQSAMAIGLMHDAGGKNYLALIIGMLLVCIIYLIIALVVNFVGTSWLHKILPPLVVGPIIMVIGLSLAGSAIANLTTNGSGQDADYNWVCIISGMIAMLVTAFTAHYGKGTLQLIPFVLGMGAGYIFALIMTGIGYGADSDYMKVVNFDPFKHTFGKDYFSGASIFNYKMFVPNDAESFIFLRFDQIKEFDWSMIGEVILLFAPVSLVTVCEHIGDHTNLGTIINRDLLNGEPGMHRTLTGDGVATAISGILCGAANTTYGENEAVIGTTRVASVNVVTIAAILSVVIGFFTPFTALLETMPACVTGGVALILYGFIASSGIKMLVLEQIDFNQTKNIFVSSVILVSGIGGFTWRFGKTMDPKVTITSLAVSMILGIVLNFVLIDRPAPQDSSNNSSATEPRDQEMSTAVPPNETEEEPHEPVEEDEAQQSV